MLQVKDLEVGYAAKNGNTVVVCSGLGLQVDPGTLVMLAGRNGSGKSSLLRCLASLQKPLAGDIQVNTTSLPDADAPLVASLVTIMFSIPPDMENSTVAEVVLTSMQRDFSPFKTDFTEEWKKVEKSLEVCGVSEFFHRHFESLSDGEKQKVMLARSIAQDTPVLLLDEPLAFLDYPARREMMSLLRKLCSNEGKTIVFSSHDLDISMAYCDNLLLLRGEGKWEFYDSTEKIGMLRPESLFNTEN